ncbi:MAG: PrsW family glutamic-type intramembrane protease [Anaerolineae bacterium]|nr:PrsW family glutamic-type intramembrane protease [Anaerolineae bacterium]
MRKTVQVLAAIGGASAAVLGVIAGLLYAVSSWLGEGAGAGRVQSLATSGVFIALGLGLGLPLAWTGLQALGGRPSRLLRWPRPGLLVLLFVLALIIGQVVLSAAPLPWLFFPPFYVLSVVLSVGVVLSLVGERLARGGLAVTWRELLAQLGSGAFLGTMAAFTLEAVAILILVLGVVTMLALIPGGLEWLETWLAAFRAPGRLVQPDWWLPLLRSPWVIGLVLLVASGLAPAIEEAVKALGVPLMGYRRPGRARAFLWGVAGGAGFTLVEGLLSGTLALASERFWGLAIVARAGTGVSHCLGGGLMGLGWQALLSRRGWRGLGCYGLAVALHGLWNALSTGVTLLSLLLMGGHTDEMTWSLGSMLVYAVLGGLVVTELGLLVYISRRLAGTGGGGEQVRRPGENYDQLHHRP